MNIQVSPIKCFVWLLVFIHALLLLNVVGIILQLNVNQYEVTSFITLFNFNLENNIPSFYSSFALLMVSGLLSIITSAHYQKGDKYLAWLFLSGIFLFLSFDEMTSVHEMLGDSVRESFNTSGLLYYAWIIPYGIGVSIFALSYLKFLIALPVKIRKLFVLAGVTFVTGAVGFEALGGRQHILYGRENLTYSLFYTCEEYLEMFGIAIFVYALLSYMAVQLKHVQFSLNDSDKLNLR